MLGILREIAGEVARAVASIPCGGGRETVCMGADGTPTSEVDKVAENTVLMEIERRGLPLNVLSEEIGFVDNGADDVLVLDPVDGTSNSLAGIPFYTVSMAVGRSGLGDVRLAYIRNLATGEEYWAERGRGAFCDGEPIHAKADSDPAALVMMMYLGNGADADAFSLVRRVKTVRTFGCASLEMAYVAAGMADGYLMKARSYSRAIRVVDIAASALILREAGGEVFGLDGKPLDMPFDLEHRANFLAVGDRRVYGYVMGGGAAAAKPRYGVYANMSIPAAKDVARRVIAALDGEDVVLDSEIAGALGVEGRPISEMHADTVVTVGGDGTVLRAFMNTDAKIVGVNAGGIGFLTEIDAGGIEEGIRRIRAGDYAVQSRSKIRIRHRGEVLGDAVNEVVIHTDSVAKIRRFRVCVDGSLVTDIRADGIMLSTPTGSTCYAMSLGAPIIDNRVDAWVMVPMAAFKFSSRPMVIPTGTKVTVEMVLDKGCLLVIDGQREVPVPGGSTVELTRSPETARFIQLDTDFYGRVREKLVSQL